MGFIASFRKGAGNRGAGGRDENSERTEPHKSNMAAGAPD